MRTWGEKYVDDQIEASWVELRTKLADRFADVIDTGETDEVALTTPEGYTVFATVADGRVVVSGDEAAATGNVDEAAYRVVEILRGDWEVLHPVYLSGDLVEHAEISDDAVRAERAVVVPELATAESPAQLQTWVEATFQDGMDEPLKVQDNGAISWRTPAGNAAVVRVRNAARIEIYTVLAREVSFKKARAVIDDLSRKYFGFKFFLVQDGLLMSRTLHASPYVPTQLEDAFGAFVQATDELDWVHGKVLRKRAKADRQELDAARERVAQLESDLAEMEAKHERVRKMLDFQVRRRRWASRRAHELRVERDAAREELRQIRSMLKKMMRRTDPATTERGAA